MKQYSFLFIGVLLLVAGVRGDEEVASDEYADESDRAHLIVRKSIQEDVVVQGRNVTVSIDIYNTGASTASNVQLEDILPEGAKLLDGSLAATIPKISVGSQVKHSYVIVFTTGSPKVALPIATVTYAADDSKNVQIGYSSVQGFPVRTPVQQILQYGLVAGRYLSLGLAKTETDWRNLAILVGVVGSALGINYAIKAAGVARVTRKRTWALEELEKNQ